jgi:hypothetical protein
MPPSIHSCIRCNARLPLAGDIVECPECRQGYRIEPAKRGVRVYPLGSDLSLTELRLETLHEWAEEQREVEC